MAYLYVEAAYSIDETRKPARSIVVDDASNEYGRPALNISATGSLSRRGVEQLRDFLTDWLASQETD